MLRKPPTNMKEAAVRLRAYLEKRNYLNSDKSKSNVFGFPP